MKTTWLKALMGATALTLTAGTVAHAQSPADFFKGKNVNIVVGFSAGGGYDQYARLLSRHIGRHIPGQPNIIVQNSPGAGSLTAVRRIDANLPKDGTAMVTFNPALITESLTDPARIKVKFSDVAWIGSITRDFRVCYTWAATKLKTWEDLANRKEVIFGGTAKGTGSYVNGAILRNVFGLPIRHILGFPGSAEQRLAIERGELEGDCGSWSSIPTEWVRDNKVNTFVVFSEVRTPDMPKDAPYIGRFAKTDEQKQLLQLLGAAGEVGRPYIMSKEVPADRVKAMRAAFDATMEDKAFLADAEKQGLPVFPATGAEAEKIITEINQFSPELVTKAKAAIQ